MPLHHSKRRFRDTKPLFSLFHQCPPTPSKLSPWAASSRTKRRLCEWVRELAPPGAHQARIMPASSRTKRGLCALGARAGASKFAPSAHQARIMPLHHSEQRFRAHETIVFTFPPVPPTALKIVSLGSQLAHQARIM